MDITERAFVFDGISTREYGVLVSGRDIFTTPSKDMEDVTVPGRNGTLKYSNDRYNNVPITYHCHIYKDFIETWQAIKDMLVATDGYCRLEDTFEPEVFRKACFEEQIKPKMVTDYTMGKFDVEFDCKPEKWLKIGEETITKTANFTLENPTKYPAKPLIRVYGMGELRVGTCTITINSASTYTDIDSELQDCYKGQTNCNGNVTLNSGDFPILGKGSSGVILGSGITKVEIKPRWWTI